MRTLIAIIALIVAMYLFKVFYLDAKSGQEAQKSAAAAPKDSNTSGKLPVDVYVAKLVDKNTVAYASGTTVPNEQVELKSEVPGRLVQLNIDEGGSVQKGQLIAKIDDADILAQLKKLKYEEQLAQQTEARQRRLLEINAISKEEYDMAVNRVNTLSADKEFLQVQLDRTSVVAPFSGRIGLKNISDGAYVTPGTTIVELVQTNPIKLDFSLPEKYSNKVKVGQAVKFSIDGTDEVMDARVLAIDPRVDEDLRTITVRCRASNRGGRLLPGMFVRVEVPLGDESSIMIPSKSIIPILKGKKVFVLRDGVATEVEIKTGLRTDNEVQVESGLEPGDSVIVSALMRLKAGLPVSVNNLVP